MDLSHDIETDQDPSPGPEIENQEHQSGRQKPSALLEPFHPPTVIAKLCSSHESSAFRRNTRRISDDVRGNYAVPPGAHPEAIESYELCLGMKRAAVDISRSKFEVYNFATKHGFSDAAVDELLQMLSNVGTMAILFTIVFVWTGPLAGWRYLSFPS